MDVVLGPGLLGRLGLRLCAQLFFAHRSSLWLTNLRPSLPISARRHAGTCELQLTRPQESSPPVRSLQLDALLLRLRSDLLDHLGRPRALLRAGAVHLDALAGVHRVLKP